MNLITKDQLDELVLRYHKKGITPPLIGTYLRDLHLVNLKQALTTHYKGQRLTQAYTYLDKNVELKVFQKKLEKVQKHSKKNKKDYAAVRKIPSFKAILHRLKSRITK